MRPPCTSPWLAPWRTGDHGASGVLITPIGALSTGRVLAVGCGDGLAEGVRVVGPDGPGVCVRLAGVEPVALIELPGQWRGPIHGLCHERAALREWAIRTEAPLTGFGSGGRVRSARVRVGIPGRLVLEVSSPSAPEDRGTVWCVPARADAALLVGVEVHAVGGTVWAADLAEVVAGEGLRAWAWSPGA